MTSHIEQQIAARIARVHAKAERRRQEREELAAARTAGVAKRHAQKLYRQAHPQSETEDEPMPAALRTATCPSCCREWAARLVATVVVSGRPYDVLRCPESSCEVMWLVRAERPRTAPVAA